MEHKIFVSVQGRVAEICEETVPPGMRAEESGKRAGTHLRLGNWVAGAQKPDCDNAREALFPNPPETKAGKGDGRLVD